MAMPIVPVPGDEGPKGGAIGVSWLYPQSFRYTSEHGAHRSSKRFELLSETLPPLVYMPLNVVPTSSRCVLSKTLAIAVALQLVAPPTPDTVTLSTPL